MILSAFCGYSLRTHFFKSFFIVQSFLNRTDAALTAPRLLPLGRDRSQGYLYCYVLVLIEIFLPVHSILLARLSIPNANYY